MKKIKVKNKKKFFIILAMILVLFIAGDWILSVMVYNENFNRRFESYQPLMFHVEDFDGLQRKQYEFSSDQGQKLTGYLYSAGEDQHGIIIMAHGFGGGGHNSYMDSASYFAQHGYYVFAYDATGNDESEGEGVGGLPQGVIDLDYAISFIEESGNFPDLPIALFGHSWGGYSVCSVLTYHPEVKAVIACSGFSSSSDMFEIEGKKQAGDGIYLMLPFVKLHERIQYGKYASNNAMNGFLASKAAVMVVHGTNDDVVPIECSYEKYYAKYKDDPRFAFVCLDGRDHNVFNNSTYIDAFNQEFDQWLETLNYDYNAEECKEQFITDKADYINRNLDRSQWSNVLDKELYEDFVIFYNEHIND